MKVSKSVKRVKGGSVRGNGLNIEHKSAAMWNKSISHALRLSRVYNDVKKESTKG